VKKPRVLLLAAGHGRRAGGPKAWRDHEGKPMLERQLEFLTGFVEPSKIAVSIQAEWLERCRALSGAVSWVPVDPDLSAFASLQSLIRAAKVEPSFVYHVDMPVFDASVFAKLAEAAGDASPVHEGRRGHPVFLTTITLLDLLRVSPAAGRLDEFLAQRGTIGVEVASPLIHANLNEAPA
jgi:CTP:molybdopterin cytidylyltransferase MocA